MGDPGTRSADCLAGQTLGDSVRQWPRMPEPAHDRLGKTPGQYAHRHPQPGKPQQNADVERYHRTGWYDGLNQHLFDSITDVQDFATCWLWTHPSRTSE